MRKGKKSLVLLLIFAMALSLFPQTAYAAKKKVKLNKKSVTVNVGKTVKIKLKNNKKKVKWSSSKKSVVSVSSGKVKGIKAGTAYIYAKVGKRTLKCKVTVKEPDKSKRINLAKKEAKKSVYCTSPPYISISLLFFYYKDT